MDLKHFLRKARIALTPRSFYLVTRLSNGALVYGQNKNGYGGRGIYVYHDFIEPELLHLESLLSPSGTFIDIGANTGMYALKAAKFYNNTGTVIAIEPFPEVIHDLFISQIKNNFTNLRLRNFCAGEFTGSKILWMNNNHPNTFSMVIREGNAKGMNVLVVSVDDLVSWEKLERVDYIKIDAEGAEREIIMGAMKVINKYRPLIQVEILIDFEIPLTDYYAYKAPNSINVVYVPAESDKLQVVESLKWEKVR